jgi:hypothetical protein
MHHCLYFSSRRNWPPTRNLNFLSVRKEAISLMRLVKYCNFDSLCSRTECHVVSKNTTAVDILLKFRVVWATSLKHWSVEKIVLPAEPGVVSCRLLPHCNSCFNDCSFCNLLGAAITPSWRPQLQQVDTSFWFSFSGHSWWSWPPSH